METVTKYKLLKDLPDVKAGTVVQFFGLFDDEPYKSMIKESQYIPEIGWYWKSDIKTGKNDTVNFNQYCKCNYNVDTLPEWFAPYLFTAEDGDVFKGDNVYFINKNNEIITCYNAIGISQDFNKNQIFLSKEKAEQYLESLKPKFKVGDIVANDKNRIGKIVKIKTLKDKFNNDYKACEIQYEDGCIYNNDLQFVRLANSDEIISYYEQQGWVKGAKFKSNGETCILDNLYFGHTGTLCVESTGFKKFRFEDCELIKEPNYPKSLEDIKSHILETNYSTEFSRNIVTGNYKQYDSLLAFSLLTVLHRAMIDEYNKVNNCDWKPDWTNDNQNKFVITRSRNRLNLFVSKTEWRPLAFPDKISVEFSLLHHESLWKQYYELD
jgi:hypothetical protein